MTLSSRIFLCNAIFLLIIALLIMSFESYEPQSNTNTVKGIDQSQMDSFREREVAMIKELYGDD